jgi:Predicted membrane protein (DUF2154).
MADVPVPSLTRARELKIEELSTYFANDDLSLDDLERRIELVYKASSVVELETITADLRASVMVPQDLVRARVVPGTAGAPATYEVPNGRILALMSSSRRVGRWALPRRLDVLAIMSDTRIDLTQAALPPGFSEIKVRAVMTSLRVIVPPGVRVVVDAHSVMADVQSSADEPTPDMPPSASAPIIRLTGFALMSEVKVVVRRREDPLLEDGDE